MSAFRQALISMAVLIALTGCRIPFGGEQAPCGCGDACADGEPCAEAPACEACGWVCGCGLGEAGCPWGCSACGGLPHCRERCDYFGPLELPPRPRFHPVPVQPVFAEDVAAHPGG